MDGEDDDSNLNKGIGGTRSTPERIDSRHTAQHQYSTVRQVLQSEETGQEIRQDEVVKGYEVLPNEFAAIDPQEIKAAEIETSDTIDLFHFVKATNVDPIYFERSYYVAPDSGAEKITRCYSKRCGKRSASGLPGLGCTGGSTC
ncbi:MAG: end-binding protein Ku [Acidobacteriaceae bacterium]|jgi:non-homologous end joining protein Ku